MGLEVVIRHQKAVLPNQVRPAHLLMVTTVEDMVMATTPTATPMGIRTVTCMAIPTATRTGIPTATLMAIHTATPTAMDTTIQTPIQIVTAKTLLVTAARQVLDQVVAEVALVQGREWAVALDQDPAWVGACR